MSAQSVLVVNLAVKQGETLTRKFALWAPKIAATRANTTAYAKHDVIAHPTEDDRYYRAIVAGTSGGSAPTLLLNPGATFTDGGVTWVVQIDTYAPMNLAGCSARARFRESPSSPIVADLTSPSGGLAIVELDAEITLTMPPHMTRALKPLRHGWDMMLTFADGVTVEEVFRGGLDVEATYQ